MQTAGYRRIAIKKADGTIRGYTLVDEQDAEWAEQWTWRLVAGQYAGRVERVRGENRTRTIYLHRALAGLGEHDSRQVDHRNRDKLDNRRQNLRIVTPAQQSQNRPSPRHARSSYRGVCWVGGRGRVKCWQGRVRVDGKLYYGPCTTSEIEAAEWARQMREKLMTHAED